jgi:hypothetical protein
VSWGTTLSGLAGAVDVLEAVKLQWSGETLYVAGPTVNYAVYQEQGTSKVEARPYMRPASDRVKADPEKYAKQMAASQGIDISSESGFVRALALAVQNEGKKIADAKGVRDTGALIASISIEEVS